MSIFLDPFILLFYISLLIIIWMIILKTKEIKTSNKSRILGIFSGYDQLIIEKYFKIKKLISYINTKSAVALIQFIAYHILSWARNCYIWLHHKAHAHPPSKKVIDMVRGRGDAKRNGGSSLFLKRISEKDEVGEIK